MFPYYIVRFKPGHLVTPSKTSAKFPYYIVRFKRSGTELLLDLRFGFHTT